MERKMKKKTLDRIKMVNETRCQPSCLAGAHRTVVMRRLEGIHTPAEIQN